MSKYQKMTQFYQTVFKIAPIDDINTLKQS